MRILDLFCCAGGASMGYHQAGFEVVGVDIEPQPRYPYEFVRADAVEFIRDHGAGFDAIHASPPCQAYTPLNAYNHKSYPDLVEATREALIATGRPWVIENVPQAPLRSPVTLCGPMLGLRVYRHRDFEVGGGLRLTQLDHSPHTRLCARNGYLPTAERPFMTISGGAHSQAWQHAACDAMGMPWVKVPPGGDTRRGIREVCEAIPPAYTRLIGAALAAHLDGQPAGPQPALF